MKSITLFAFASALVLTSGMNVKATAQEVKLDSQSIATSSINYNVDNKQIKDSLNWSCSIFRRNCAG